ncbi:hypothetical protein [Xenorhabdus griffiniae]
MDELTDLDEKVTKISDFIGSVAYYQLAEVERVLSQTQLSCTMTFCINGSYVLIV